MGKRGADLEISAAGETVPVELNLQPSPSEQQLEVESTAEAPPDGGYGWVCLACCFTINGFSWGVAAVSLMSSLDCLGRRTPYINRSSLMVSICRII